MKSCSSPLSTLAFLLSCAAGISGCAEFFETPVAPTANDATPSESSSASASAAPTATAVTSAPTEEPSKEPAAVKLDAFGIPLSIDLAPGTRVKRGIIHPEGVEIGDMTSEVGVWIFKADESVKTLARAKARKRVSGCDAQKVVKEGPDYYVFQCKMRSMEPLTLLFLREIDGVTYGCESANSVESPEDLDRHIAACRTLKRL